MNLDIQEGLTKVFSLIVLLIVFNSFVFEGRESGILNSVIGVIFITIFILMDKWFAKDMNSEQEDEE